MSRRLRLQTDGQVAILTLTSPELLNRFDADLHGEFLKAVDEISVSQARAVVLAAEGRCFSAGGDVDLMVRLHDDPELRRAIDAEARAVFEAVPNLPMPVVCALHGDAVGLGASIVLSCDAIVASRNARLSDPHVVFGLVPGDGGCVLWPQAMGLLPSRYFLLTGDKLDAERAYGMGIVNTLVAEPDEVLAAALELAGRLAALPPLGVQGAKRALSHVLRLRADEVFDLAKGYELDTLASRDLLEAVSAFKDRRPGQFEGR